MLDENFVYPGHPVVIALEIIREYDSLNEATALGRQFQKASENSMINGAGGRVSSTLYLMTRKSQGLPWFEFFEQADRIWDGEHFSDHELGKEKANALRQQLIDEWKGWKRD